MDDKRDQLRTALLDLTSEQMQEYFTFGTELQHFMYQMRLKFVEEMIEGKKGWNEASIKNLVYRIDRQIMRKPHDSQESSIDIANLAFILWYQIKKKNEENRGASKGDGKELAQS